jgi:hypothetical protein
MVGTPPAEACGGLNNERFFWRDVQPGGSRNSAVGTPPPQV